MGEPGNTIAGEISRFDAMASTWWDADGPMRALLRMNPARIGWIAARCAPGARVLDVGCGGGIAAEALARRGFPVLGIDAAGAAIAAARAHAPAGLDLVYRRAVTTDLLAEPERFDVICALEVIEHVADPAAFLRELAALLAPGGSLFLSTLSRTPASFVAAKLVAEYALRWLPVGTHDWRRFITPVEMGGLLRGAGLAAADLTGLVPDLIRGGWRADRNTAVNYLLMAR